MSALDSWLVDGEEIRLGNGATITCKGLKAAIRVEMQEAIKNALRYGVVIDGRHFLLTATYVPSPPKEGE